MIPANGVSVNRRTAANRDSERGCEVAEAGCAAGCPATEMAGAQRPEALLRGLSGEAKTADGQVTVHSLAAYVTREVPAWAARNRREQTPRYTNPREQDFAVLPARLAPPATPPTPTSSSGSGPAILPVYLAQWRAQMPANLRYRIRAQDNMPQVLIPAGEFLMGSPPDEANRGARLAPSWGPTRRRGTRG